MTQNKLLNNVFYTECVMPCLAGCNSASFNACGPFPMMNPGCLIRVMASCAWFIKGGMGEITPPSSDIVLPSG